MRKEEVLTLIFGAIREVLPEVHDHEFREADSLEGLGANSMDRAEIVITVLEQIPLEVPLVETFGPQNLGELAQHLSTMSLDASWQPEAGAAAAAPVARSEVS